MPNVHVETRLLEAEYELLKDFKEKNGLKTDYQGLKELVKALDIPEFHEEIKTEEKKEVKTEVKPIDRSNLENWVRDLSFEQKEVWNFYKAKSFDDGVKHVRAEHSKMNFKSASDMTKEELERMTFTLNFEDMDSGTKAKRIKEVKELARKALREGTDSKNDALQKIAYEKIGDKTYAIDETNSLIEI